MVNEETLFDEVDVISNQNQEDDSSLSASAGSSSRSVTSTRPSTPSHISTTPSSKRRRVSSSAAVSKSSAEDTLDTVLMDYLNRKSEYDEDTHFLLSQAGPLKRLSESNRSFAKFKIHELIYNLEKSEKQAATTATSSQPLNDLTGLGAGWPHSSTTFNQRDMQQHYDSSDHQDNSSQVGDTLVYAHL